MGKPTGFLEYKRETAKVLAPKVRIADFHEFRTPMSREKQRLQGARCMACGVPFCQSGMMIGGMASGSIGFWKNNTGKSNRTLLGC